MPEIKIPIREENNRDFNGYGNFEHQNEAHEALTNSILNGNQNQAFSGLLAIPTGGGKTFIAVEWLLENWIDEGGKVLWIAHRHELLNQAFRTFERNTCKNLLPNFISGLPSYIQYRIISGQAKHDRAVDIKPGDHVLIAGKDSLRSGTGMNALFENWINPNNLKEDGLFLVIDEAHHATAKTYRELIDALKEKIRDNLKILGLTATPFRTDNASLTNVFPNDIVCKTDLRTLISKGILSEPVFEEKNTGWHAVKNLDLENYDFDKIRRFDLPGGLKTRIAKETARNKQIVRHYLDNREKYGKTLVFALNKNHAERLNNMFKEDGIKADFVVSGRNNNNEVKIKRFREGKTEVLVNVEIVTEGTDLPQVRTVFLTRPTISKILMTQMIGRGLRGIKSGGTRQAHIVSFIDDWQDKIAWKTPESVFAEEIDFVEKIEEGAIDNLENREKRKKREKWVASRISLEKMAEFARILDSAVDTSALERLSFLERIPVGFYDFSLLEIREEDQESVERSCEVLVYDHFEKQYACFVEDLPNIFAEQNKTNLSERELDRLSENMTDKHFQYVRYQLAFREEDVKDILRYYFDTQERPCFVRFDERKAYDIDKIAREIYEKDFRVSEKTNFVNNLWEQDGRAWKELFGRKKSCFLNETDLALRKITHGIELLQEAAVTGEAPKHFTNTLGMKFVLIPPGEFLMGSPEDEPNRFDDEKQHRVKISRAFYMQTTTVTQGQWEKLMGNNPSHFKDGGNDCPVECVSWNDAQVFVKKLNQTEKTDKYRLPTEAEWEYACRAGTTTPFCFGETITPDLVNYNENYPYGSAPEGEHRGKTTDVGSFPPNAFGLYDMHGNVWEWCRDWYDSDYYSNSPKKDPLNSSGGSLRVARGGSWNFSARHCRAATRGRSMPDGRFSYLGLRLALSLGQQ